MSALSRSRAPAVRNPTLAEYVREAAAARLGRVAFEVRRCLHRLDAERIHDLRVAARRLVELLDVFKSFLPKGAKEARRELRQMMTLAGEVRNLDIAIELLRSVGAPPAAALIQTLRDERASAESRLGELLRRQHRTEASLRWRQALDLAP